MPAPETNVDVRTAEGDVVVFHALPVFGAASVSSVRCKQAAFARTGVGTYEFRLPRAYPRLLAVSAVIIGRAGVPLTPQVSTDATGSTGIVTIQLEDPTGAPADPNSGEKALFEVTVSGRP